MWKSKGSYVTEGILKQMSVTGPNLEVGWEPALKHSTVLVFYGVLVALVQK